MDVLVAAEQGLHQVKDFSGSQVALLVRGLGGTRSWEGKARTADPK